MTWHEKHWTGTSGDQEKRTPKYYLEENDNWGDKYDGKELEHGQGDVEL
jgi:hypothetical protein